MSYHIKWVINRWKNHKKMVFILLFLTILSVSVSVAYPLVFKYLLDTLKNIIVHPDNFPTPMKEVNRILWIIFAIGIASLISYLYPGMRGYMNLLFEYIL
ncbi:ABC transporter permease, partial [candidate division WOR-3 bacterium]|nr:ABC transporter permease [candidate division WOR-3 bacterium]